MSSDTPQYSPPDKDVTNNLEYIGSALASIVIVSFTAVMVAATLGYADLSAVPQPWFVGVVVPLLVMSAIQAFGKDVYEIFKSRAE
jgi:hypothetical protein